MNMMAILTVIVGVGLGVCLFTTALLRWNEMRYKKKGLPPGTMGWPLFGETTDFLKLGPSFMKNQSARYGSVFKSHILGCPTIVSMDPELNKYILMSESKGLVPGYPQSMLDILGRFNIAAVHGPAHKKMRGALISFLSPYQNGDQILPKIDEFMRSHLSNWTNQVVDIQEKTKEMALLISLKLVSGIDGSCSFSKQLKTHFFDMVLGTFSLPINLPNTNYHRGLQARKKIVRMLEKLVEERKNSEERHDDMLGLMLLMNGVESRYRLSHEEIIDQLITILHSGEETVSTVSMMAVKYLHHHPTALQQLRKEHLEIRERKMAEEPLVSDDYKSMKFTRAVILEADRLATVVNGVMRKTVKDVELNGYVIPEGWKIYVYTREINYDSHLYPDPYMFNPWRWLNEERSLETHNYFLLFGGGMRHCPGKELGILEVSAFLHYFVTRYRWEEVGGVELLEFPRVEASNGLHIRVSDLLE